MSEGMERTLVILKPDSIQRGLVGTIIQRFEQKGLKLVAVKMMNLNTDILDKHYAHHKGKNFFAGLKAYMGSAPCIVMVWQGLEAVLAVRELCGITKARAAEAGSIRGDFAMSYQQNLVHASDAADTAKKEINLFFPDDREIFDWKWMIETLLYSEEEIQ